MDEKESLEKGYQHFKDEANQYRFTAQRMEQDPKWQNDPLLFVARVVSEGFDKILRCIEEGKPFIAGWYCAAPEIYVAMDLPWYTIMQTPFLPVSRSSLLHDIDETEKMGLGTDLCTAIRLSMYGIKAGLMPPPTAIVGLIHPCDGVAMLHNVVEHNKVWRNIPIFTSDPPYFEDDRSIDYFTGEVKRMKSFLEEHTGRRLDIDRLREVIEESNKQYELWAEYNELRRALPCPHGWGIGVQCSTVAQNFAVGDPRGDCLVQGTHCRRRAAGAGEEGLAAE